METIAKSERVALSERDLLRSILTESYEEFVREMWETVVPEKLVWNWHMSVMCREIQKAVERLIAKKRKKYDLIFNISPGTSKSSICSVFLVPWIWTRMPTLRSINASHTQDLVLDLSRKSRDVVRSEKYQELFPEVELREDQDTKGYWVNTSGGDRFSCTVGGKTPTGFHGHLLIVDDPLDPQKTASEQELKTANNFMRETLPTRKVNKKTALTILVMQRLHQDDPTGNRLDRLKDGSGAAVRHICLPATLDRPGVVRPKKLEKNYKKGLMDPKRMDRRVLDDAATELGEYGYAGQFDQHPIPRGGALFKPSQLQVVRMSVEEAMRKCQRTVRYWDKAGTAGGGAYSVGLQMGYQMRGRDPHYYIMDVVRGQWGATDREAQILQTAKLDGRGVKIGVEQEPGSSGKESAEATVRMLAGFRCLMDRPTGDKEVRAEPFAGQVNIGNVTILVGTWNKAFIDEMTMFPKSRYKDQIDAGSGSFHMLTKKRTIAGAI